MDFTANTEVIFRTVSLSLRIVSVISVFMVLIAVIRMKSHSKRMGWFIAVLCIIMGGLSSEFMADSGTVFNLIAPRTSRIRAHVFYAMVAPFFSLYFIETEREENAKWDGFFWTTLQSLLSFLVIILSMFDTGGYFEWFTFLIQYIVVIFMLLISSKDIKESVIFIIGNLFPMIAALLGMIDKNLDTVAYGVSGLMLIVFFGYQSDLERELLRKKMELSENRVLLLMEQIHPHFIYNSLQQIALLCDREPESVKQAIYNFSGYLRSNFETLTNDGTIPFMKEMEHVDMYISLAQILPSREFVVEKKLEVTDFEIPALTLQPLVENAIQYGIGMSTQGDRITIETKIEKGYIVINVSDNGGGIVKQLPTQKKHKSVGTKNVKDRLKILCDGKYEITRGPEGTKSSIYIPYKKN